MAIDIGNLAKRFLLTPLASAAGSANRWADNYSFGGPNWREKGALLLAEKRARLRYLESQIEENQSQAARNLAASGRETETFNLNKELTLAQIRQKTREEAALHKRATDAGLSDSDFLAKEASDLDKQKTLESNSRVMNIQHDNDLADKTQKAAEAARIEAATTRNLLTQSTVSLNNARAQDLADKKSGAADQIDAYVQQAKSGELTQEQARAIPMSMRGQVIAAIKASGTKLMSKSERDDVEQMNTLESDLNALKDMTKSGEHTGWQASLNNLPVVGELTRTPAQQKVDALTMRILSTNLKERSGAAITGTARQAYSELQRGLMEFPTTTNTDTNYQAKIDTLLDAIKRSRGVAGAPLSNPQAAGSAPASSGESLAPAAPSQTQIGRFLVEPE